MFIRMFECKFRKIYIRCDYIKGSKSNYLKRESVVEVFRQVANKYIIFYIPNIKTQIVNFLL